MYNIKLTRPCYKKKKNPRNTKNILHRMKIESYNTDLRLCKRFLDFITFIYAYYNVHYSNVVAESYTFPSFADADEGEYYVRRCVYRAAFIRRKPRRKSTPGACSVRALSVINYGDWISMFLPHLYAEYATATWMSFLRFYTENL